MLKNILFKTGVVLTFALIIFSCSSDDDSSSNFEENPSARIDARTQELRDLLVNEAEAYKVVYFTNKEQFGGFTFFMRFNEDGTVDMTSDVDSETEISTGQFDVDFNTSVELVFTTRTQIHKLTDGGTPGLEGSGFEGSSNFIYRSNEEGVLTFYELRGDVTLKFMPVADTDFVSIVNKHLENETVFSPPVLGFCDPVSGQLAAEFSEGGTQRNLLVDYDSLRRYMVITNDEGIESSYSIALTEEGFFSEPAISLGGQEFVDFKVNQSNNGFISTNESGATAEIKYKNIISDDYLLVDDLDTPDGKDQFIFLPGFLATAEVLNDGNITLCFFQAFVDADNAIDTSTQRDLSRLELQFDDFGETPSQNDQEGRIRYRYSIGTSNFSVYHYFTWEIIDKKIVLTSVRKSSFRVDLMSALDDIFFAPEGISVDMIQKKYNFSNDIFVFTGTGAFAGMRFPSYSAVL